MVIAGAIALRRPISLISHVHRLAAGRRRRSGSRAFFRDPVRTTPRGDRLIIAPADGLITMIAKVPPPPELRGADGLADGDYTRVSIFMSVFDVHINRAPIAGRVKRIAYVPGKFVNADLDKASEDNERQHFLIEGADGTARSASPRSPASSRAGSCPSFGKAMPSMRASASA